MCGLFGLTSQCAILPTFPVTNLPHLKRQKPLVDVARIPFCEVCSGMRFLHQLDVVSFGMPATIWFMPL
jgi:hypothetical protein